MDISSLGKIAGTVAQVQGPLGGKASGFADLLEEAAQNALKSGGEADRQSLAAVEGKADLNSVISAVSTAEVNLQGIVAVRDKVIAAYQEILRMPI